MLEFFVIEDPGTDLIALWGFIGQHDKFLVRMTREEFKELAKKINTFGIEKMKPNGG